MRQEETKKVERMASPPSSGGVREGGEDGELAVSIATQETPPADEINQRRRREMEEAEEKEKRRKWPQRKLKGVRTRKSAQKPSTIRQTCTMERIWTRTSGRRL